MPYAVVCICVLWLTAALVCSTRVLTVAVDTPHPLLKRQHALTFRISQQQSDRVLVSSFVEHF